MDSDGVRLPGQGLSLAADAYGDPGDPPVMLLHGGGQTRHSWGATAQVLAKQGWRAITVDLRGHGDSDWSPDGTYDLDTFAGDVRTAALSLDRPPVLVGASLGGNSSLIAVGEAPGEVATGLVLVDIAPRIEPEGVAHITAFMTGYPDGFASLEEVADAVAAYNPHRPRPKNLDGLLKNVRLRDDGRYVWHWDPRFLDRRQDEPRSLTHEGRLKAAARALTLPTLLVRGGQSDIVSPEGARELQELVPHARLADVAEAGHMVAGDQNDPFNDAIIAFLDEEIRPKL